MTRSGTFGQYNYGQEMNKIMYGSEEPPRYNLTDVTVPVSIYYGAGDFLVTSKVINKNYVSTMLLSEFVT